MISQDSASRLESINTLEQLKASKTLIAGTEECESAFGAITDNRN